MALTKVTLTYEGQLKLTFNGETWSSKGHHETITLSIRGNSQRYDFTLDANNEATIPFSIEDKGVLVTKSGDSYEPHEVDIAVSVLTKGPIRRPTTHLAHIKHDVTKLISQPDQVVTLEVPSGSAFLTSGSMQLRATNISSDRK
jgi:hypothetical protein